MSSVGAVDSASSGTNVAHCDSPSFKRSPNILPLRVGNAVNQSGQCSAQSILTPTGGVRVLNERKTFPDDFNNGSKNQGKSVSQGSLWALCHQDNPCSGDFGRAQKRGTMISERLFFWHHQLVEAGDNSYIIFFSCS